MPVEIVHLRDATGRPACPAKTGTTVDTGEQVQANQRLCHRCKAIGRNVTRAPKFLKGKTTCLT